MEEEERRKRKLSKTPKGKQLLRFIKKREKRRRKLQRSRLKAKTNQNLRMMMMMMMMKAGKMRKKMVRKPQRMMRKK